MNFCLRLTTGLVFTAALLLGAPLAQPELTADQHEHDVTTGETVLRGQARLVFDQAELRADEIRYSVPQGLARAQGHVLLVSGARRVLAESLTYDLARRTYQLQAPRLGEAPLVVVGESAEGNAEGFVLKNATVSLGEPGPYTPSLFAETIRYESKGDQGARIRKARLGIGLFKPLPLPSLSQKAALELSTKVSLTAGLSSNLGAYLDTSLRLPLSSSFLLGPDLGVYTRRGVLAGPGADYDWKGGEGRFAEGKLHTGYLSDKGPVGFDLLGEAIGEDRGFLTWEHRQHLGADLHVEGQFNYWSDSEVYRDFRQRSFFEVQVPDSYFEAVKVNDNSLLSLFSRFRPNDFHPVQQRLPELRLELLPSPLFEKVYQRALFGLARLRETEPVRLQPDLRATRLDAYYGLTRNCSPREWLGLTAVAGLRSTHYSGLGAAYQEDTYTRNLGEVGLDAHLLTSGTYSYVNERWKIDGLRHLLIPTLSYRYVDEAQRARGRIPAIDRRTFSSYLQPLGLSDLRSLDDLGRTNTLRLGLENRLQTRDASYGSRELAAMSFAGDFRFEREPGQRSLSDVHTELSLTPAPWLRFETYFRANGRTLATRELNTGLTLTDSDDWSLRLATHYLVGDLSEYVLDYTQRLNEVYSAYTRLHFDARRSRFNRQSYGLRQLLANSWAIRYEVHFYSGNRRESDLGFNVLVESRYF